MKQLLKKLSSIRKISDIVFNCSSGGEKINIEFISTHEQYLSITIPVLLKENFKNESDKIEKEDLVKSLISQLCFEKEGDLIFLNFHYIEE